MGLKNKNYLKIIYIILTLLFSVLFIPSVHSQEYYANITIDIDESGFVTIDGVTNYPDLITENTEVYTSKKQSYWLLNITKENVFSDYVFELTLPEGSSINYIKSSGSIRIEESLGSLTVKGFGQNESFSIIVQYQIIKKEDIAIFNFDFYVLIIAILLVAVNLSANELNIEESAQFNCGDRSDISLEIIYSDNADYDQIPAVHKITSPVFCIYSNNSGAVFYFYLIYSFPVGFLVHVLAINKEDCSLYRISGYRHNMPANCFPCMLSLLR